MLLYVRSRCYPNNWIRYINVPIDLLSTRPVTFRLRTRVRPSEPVSKSTKTDGTAQYSLWFNVGFVFNDLIRTRSFDWLKHYIVRFQLSSSRWPFNHSSMPTCCKPRWALALLRPLLSYFLALGYHYVTFNWWGNTVGSNTGDANSVPWLTVSKGRHLGRGPGEFWPIGAYSWLDLELTLIEEIKPSTSLALVKRVNLRGHFDTIRMVLGCWLKFRAKGLWCQLLSLSSVSFVLLPNIWLIFAVIPSWPCYNATPGMISASTIIRESCADDLEVQSISTLWLSVSKRRSQKRLRGCPVNCLNGYYALTDLITRSIPT